MPTWKDIDRDIQLAGYGKSKLGYQGQFNSAYAGGLLSKGFSVNDINQYLEKTGTKAYGNEFAVGGTNTAYEANHAAGPSLRDKNYYKYFGGGGGAGAGGGAAGGGNSGTNYGSGKAGDIAGALQAQAAQGNAQANNYAKQAADLQAQIEAMRQANSASIANSTKLYEAQLAESRKASEAQIKQMQDAMLTQQSTYQQQLLLAQQQQQQAAAALAEQQRQTAALQTAFVPNLEPTAAYNAVGDNRETGQIAERKASNNQLSNLSILTPGITTPADTLLASLQLA